MKLRSSCDTDLSAVARHLMGTATAAPTGSRPGWPSASLGWVLSAGWLRWSRRTRRPWSRDGRVGYSEEVIDSWARIAMERSTPLTDALRGDPVVLVSSAEQIARYPALGRGPTTGCPGLAAVAIPGPGGRPVGALGFSSAVSSPRTITPSVLRAAAQELAALLLAENVDDRARDTRPDPDTAVGPAPDLAVLNEPARRAELARLGLGDGWGEVGELVHRLDRARDTADRRRPRTGIPAGITAVGGQHGRVHPARGHPQLATVGVAVQRHRRERRPAADPGRAQPSVGPGPAPVRDGGVRRYVGVPLVSSTGITIGALCAYDGRTRRCPRTPPTTLGDLAAAIMASLQLGTTNRELHAADEQLRRLQALTAQLSCAVSQSDVADAVVRHGIELITRHGVVGVLATDGTHVRTWPTSGLPGDLVHDFLLLPLDAATPLTHAIRTGRPVLVPTLTQIGDLFPGALATHTATGTRCVLALPTRVADETLGAVAFGFETEHCIDEDVLTYARTVADLTGQALERARLYDREHDSARQLQQALLPPAPPSCPACGPPQATGPPTPPTTSVATGRRVALFGGRVGLVMGDVMGHDLHAPPPRWTGFTRRDAARSSPSPPAGPRRSHYDRLEDAITGAARPRPDPPSATGTTTPACGDVPPTPAPVTSASAGRRRAPPLPHGGQIHATGRPRRARGGTRPPRTDATVHVAPGSLCYLVRRRTRRAPRRDVNTGLDALAHHAEQLHGADPYAHCDSIMSDMTDGHHLHDAIACSASTSAT